MLKDESYHILAFDIIYCAVTYGLYSGIKIKRPVRKTTAKQRNDARIEELQAELADALKDLNVVLVERAELSDIAVVGLKISHKKFGEEKDLIGRVYEYFLKEFAVNATKEEGEYYTPHDVVQLIATLIEPFDGTLYDPACGSGGMFIQSADLIKAHQGDINRINVYGQEKEAATYRLAKMNLAIRSIDGDLGKFAADTFHEDLHKNLKADFILANPPFNQSDWGQPLLLEDDSSSTI